MASVIERFSAVVRADPGGLALADEDGNQLSFAELEERARGLAVAMASQGVRPGESVAIFGENSMRWVEGLLACAYLRCAAVGINTWYTAHEVRELLTHAEVSTVLACFRGERQDHYLRLLSDVVGEGLEPATAVKRVILDAADSMPTPALEWERLVSTGMATPDPLPESTESDIAAIAYTSGSTGTPKGVMLSSGALAFAAGAIAAAQGIEPGDRVWSHFPFFFSGGLCNFTLGGLLCGAGLVLARRFEPVQALGAIEAHRCRVIHAWPNVVRRLVDAPGYRPDRLAGLEKGTWPLDLWFGEQGLSGMKGINLYGMTETCTIFTATDSSDGIEARRDTNGRPFEGCQIKVVAEDGTPLPDGEEGQLRLRGPNLMSGYRGLPTGSGFDQEGYLITSDAGWLRDDGRLVWTGRLDDMIRTSGINVSPSEVERVLEALPGVTKAGVIGVPDAKRGEAVVAFVTLGSASGLDEERVLSWCKDRLAGYKVPSGVTVLTKEPLPLLGSGKVDRGRLRELALEPS